MFMIQGIKIHPQEIQEIIQFNPHSQSSIIYFKPLVDMNQCRIKLALFSLIEIKRWFRWSNMKFKNLINHSSASPDYFMQIRVF